MTEYTKELIKLLYRFRIPLSLSYTFGRLSRFTAKQLCSWALFCLWQALLCSYTHIERRVTTCTMFSSPYPDAKIAVCLSSRLVQSRKCFNDAKNWWRCSPSVKWLGSGWDIELLDISSRSTVHISLSKAFWR